MSHSLCSSCGTLNADVCGRCHRELLEAANALLAKLGTDAHPVEKAWEREFLALEMRVANFRNGTSEARGD